MKESEIVEEIKSMLLKYAHPDMYKVEKYKNVKTLDKLLKMWGKQHGVPYFPPSEIAEWKRELKGSKKLEIKREYPVMRPLPTSKWIASKVEKFTKGKPMKVFHLPGIIASDKKTQQKYIKRGNDLLLKHYSNSKVVTIDLNFNYGGKSHVMAAALSPIFNLSKRKRLTFNKTKTSMKPDLVRVRDGCYKDLNSPVVCGTKKKLVNLKRINVWMGETASAGEEIAIAFKSMSDQFDVKFYGSTTMGATTSITYFDLSNGGGMEIPTGYMADAHGNIYKKGVTLSWK